MGRELGYSGEQLQTFVKEEKAEIRQREKEQREREREEKEREREERRLKREAEEQERQAQLQLAKINAEIEISRANKSTTKNASHEFLSKVPKMAPLVGLMDPNRFKNVSICFIIAIQITKPLSIPQQTIFLLLHMVINHEITIFDFSRFLFATPTFSVVKSRRGSNGPVYPIKRRGFFACYRVQRTHAWRKRV